MYCNQSYKIKVNYILELLTLLIKWNSFLSNKDMYIYKKINNTFLLGELKCF